MFSHQKSVKKAFFVIQPPPRGSCLAKIRVSCQTFKMDIERSFFNPHFWPFKNHSTGQKSCFLIRRVLKKPFLLYNLPPEGLVCQNKSQLSNLQNDMERSFSLTPNFWPFKNNWTGLVFSSAKIRVSCQTFKMDIERSFSLTPHFWPFKNNWTGQKSCFLIRRVLKSLFCYTTSLQGVLFCQNKSQLSNLQNGHRGSCFGSSSLESPEVKIRVRVKSVYFEITNLPFILKSNLTLIYKKIKPSK